MFQNKEVGGSGKQAFLKGLVPMPSGLHSLLMFGLEAHDLGYWGETSTSEATILQYICQRAKNA